MYYENMLQDELYLYSPTLIDFLEFWKGNFMVKFS